MADFQSIRPDEAATFAVDFTGKLPNESIVPGSPVWTCTVSPNSEATDPAPQSRILSAPIISGKTTLVYCGTMLDGVVYTLTARVTGSSGTIAAESGDVECILRPDVIPLATLLLNPSQFRAEFPVFSDPTFYPDEQVTLWIATAKLFLDEIVWGDWYNIGLRLFVAHQLALERQNYMTSRRGAAPIGIGPASSRSVGGVSVSYDFSLGLAQGGGYWNLTLYGQRLYSMMEIVGAGPIQM